MSKPWMRVMPDKFVQILLVLIYFSVLKPVSKPRVLEEVRKSYFTTYINKQNIICTNTTLPYTLISEKHYNKYRAYFIKARES